MLRTAVVVTLMMAAMLAPARAQAGASKVLKEFGFFGIWAPDCSKPPGPGNSRRTTWVDKEGLVRFKEDLGDEYVPNEYLVLSARRLAPERIEIRIEFNKTRTQDLTITREDDRLRTVDNVSLDGGVLVRDGRILSVGAETPWLSSCQ